MPELKKSINLPHSPEKVFTFLANYSKFPSFIRGVKNISQVFDNKVAQFSDWEILINNTPVRWRQEDRVDCHCKQISFQMIEGDFGDYRGEFKVNPASNGSVLQFEFMIDWNMHAAEDLVGNILDEKADFAARWMLRSIKKALMDETSTAAEDKNGSPSEVVTDLVHYLNSEGHMIVGCFDHAPRDYQKNPFVVIPPGYGETKRDALTTAYFLAINGFNVLRYDATNHVGESWGDEVNTTMSCFYTDMISTINFMQHEFSVSSVGIVASSLASRVAARVAADDFRAKLLVSMVGVVNLQDTLKAVYSEDMIGSCIQGKKWEVTDVLGLKVSGNFLENAIENNYHSINATKKDFERIKCPVVFFAAENDTWVSLKDSRSIYELLKNGNGVSGTEFHLLRDTTHTLYENTQAAKSALRQIVVSCSKFMKNVELKSEEIRLPSLRLIAGENKLEKERLKSISRISKSTELNFWQEYLTSYYILQKSPDYKDYLDDLNRSLGRFSVGERVLDAGCGNGHLGVHLLSKRWADIQLLANNLNGSNLFEYYAVDLVENVLHEAEREHFAIMSLLYSNQIKDKIKRIYQKSDLDSPLPYDELFFDKICFSLVISYLFNPLEALREMRRVLKKRGCIVATSLKPHCDLSVIYTNFISSSSSTEEATEARSLLSNAGMIKQKESQGHYRFFSESELKGLMIAAGFVNVRILRSFGNQVNVAVAEK